MPGGPLTLDELYPAPPGARSTSPDDLDAKARADAGAYLDDLAKPLTLDEVMGPAPSRTLPAPAGGAPHVDPAQEMLPAPAPVSAPPTASPAPPSSFEPDVASELTSMYGPTALQAKLPPEYSPAFKAAAKARTAKLVELRDRYRAAQAGRVTPEPTGAPTIDPATGMSLEGGDMGGFTQQLAPEPDQGILAEQSGAAARSALENELVRAEATSRGNDPQQLTGAQRRMYLQGALSKLRRSGLMAPGTEPVFQGLMPPTMRGEGGVPTPETAAAIQADPLAQMGTPEEIAHLPRSEAEGMRARLGFQGPGPVERREMSPVEDVIDGVIGGATGLTPEALARHGGVSGRPMEVIDPGIAARRSFELAGEMLPVGGVGRMTRTAPAIFRALAMAAPGAVREGMRGGAQAGAEQFAAGAMMFGPMEIGGPVMEAAIGPKAAQLADLVSTKHPYFASGIAYSPAVIGKAGGILLSPALQDRDITLEDVAWSLLPVMEGAGVIRVRGGNLEEAVAHIKAELASTYPVGPGETVTVGDMSFGELGDAYREHLAGKGEDARRRYAQDRGPGPGPPPPEEPAAPTGSRPEEPPPQAQPAAAPPEPPPAPASRPEAPPQERPPGGRGEPTTAPPPPPSGRASEVPESVRANSLDAIEAELRASFERELEQKFGGRRADRTTAAAIEGLSPDERAAVLGRQEVRDSGQERRGAPRSKTEGPPPPPAPNVEETAPASRPGPASFIAAGEPMVTWKPTANAPAHHEYGYVDVTLPDGTKRVGVMIPKQEMPFSEETIPAVWAPAAVRQQVFGAKPKDEMVREMEPAAPESRPERRVERTPEDAGRLAVEADPEIRFIARSAINEAGHNLDHFAGSERWQFATGLDRSGDQPARLAAAKYAMTYEPPEPKRRPKIEEETPAPESRPEAPPPPALKPAPVVFKGRQEGIKTKTREVPAMDHWDLTEDIPGHPKGDTVSTDTLTKAGYQVPEVPEYYASFDKQGWKVAAKDGAEVMRFSDGDAARTMADRLNKKPSSPAQKSPPPPAPVSNEESFGGPESRYEPGAGAVETGKAMSLPTAEINADPERFQYKIVHGPEGETGSLRDTKKYNPLLASAIQVWRDPGDGKVYVINGHNRHARAVAANAPSENVIFIDAKNENAARAIGALVNIGEGRGTALDAAKFFKDSGMTMDQLREEGLKLTDRVAEDGLSLARLAPHLFSQVATGDLDMKRGVAIGARLDDHALQAKLVELVQKAEARGRKIDTATIQELADMVAGAPEGEPQQGDMFGGSAAVSLAIEKASVLAELRRRLAREKRLLSTVSKTDAAKILSRAGNVIDPEASSAAGDQATAILSVFDKLKNKIGPINDAINAVAKQVGKGLHVKASVELSYPLVVRAIEEALGRGGEERHPPSSPSPERPLRPTQGEGGGGRDAAEGGTGEEPEGGHGPLISEQRVERPVAGLGKPMGSSSLFGDRAYPILRQGAKIGLLRVMPNETATALTVRPRVDATQSLDPDDWTSLLTRLAEQYPKAESVDGPLPSGIPAELDRYRRQGGLAFAKVERGGKTYATAAGGGKRALEIFRQNYRGNAGATTVREAMQNAVDALRARLEEGGGQGGVGVTLDEKTNTITVHDTGIGMTPETASEALVELGESHKPGTGSSGGFGLAKAAIFGNADQILVKTVAEGPRPTAGVAGGRIKTILTGTGEDWMDPGKGLEITHEPTTDPRGTTVVIKLGEHAKLGYEATNVIQRILANWRLPFVITATSNIGAAWEAPTRIATEPAAGLTPLAEVKLPGGTAEILASQKGSEKDTLTYHVLNNGLFQFGNTIYLNRSIEIPNNVVVDVKASGSPTAADYPFTLDRDALRTDALTAIEKYLKGHLIADANKREIQKYKDAFSKAEKIAGTGLAVVDATGALGAIAKTIANDQVVRMVAGALDNAFQRFKRKLEQADRQYGHVVFRGLGLTDKWYGVSIPAPMIGVGSEGLNIVLLQPFLHAGKARTAQEARSHDERDALFPYSDDEAIEFMAAQAVETILHELTHQVVRDHDAGFAGKLADVHAEVAPIYADVLRQVGTTLRMPGVRSTLEAYHNEINGAIRAAGASDFLRKIGSEHTGPGKPGRGAPGPATSGGGGTRPPGNLLPGQGAAGTGGVPPAPPGGSAPRKYQPRSSSFDAADRNLRGVLQRIGGVADTERGKQPKRAARPGFEFNRGELEAEWKEAHGLPPESRFARAREEAATIYHKLTRQFQTLPRGATWEPLRFALTTYLKRWPIYDKLARQMEEYIVGPLDRTGLDVFDRKVLFESLRESIALHDKAVQAAEKTGVPMSERDRAPFMTPFGLTSKEINAELRRVNTWIATHGRDDVVKALMRRREVWPALQDALYWAHKDNGHDIGPKLLRDEYARHQVLDKAAANYSASNAGGGALRGAERASYLRRRTGTMSALNTDYLQAEFEVMRAVLADIQKERLIGLVDKRYNIIEELKAEAARMNHTEIMRILMAMAPPNLFGANGPGSPLGYAEKVMRSLGAKQAMAFEGFKKAADEGDLPDGGGEWTDLIDALAEAHAHGTPLPDEMYPRLFKYAGWVLKQPHASGAGKMAAATLFRGIAEKRRYIERNLEKARAMGVSREGFVRWNDLIPDSHQELAVRASLRTFTTYSVPEQISRPLLDALKDTLELSAKDLRRIRAIGAAEDPLVVPNEVAATLNDLGNTTQDTQIGRLVATANGYMKEWFLLAFRRVFKSGLRNLSGDADILFVGNPRAYLRLGRAIPEMWNAVVRGHMPTGDAFEYLTRGGLQSTLQSTELREVPMAREFVKFLPPKSIAQHAVEMPATVWKKYWAVARLSADYRESVLRYAAFIDYLEQMKKSPTGEPDNWGASYAPEVMALTDIHDRAFKLSNELMGAYDSVTHADRWTARQMIPFWRFQAINMRRYPALVRNAGYNRALCATLGRKAVFTAARSPLIAVRLGWTLFKMAALMAAAMAVNMLYFSDEEEDLPPEVRNRMHFVMGRGKDGSVIAFTRLGAAQDFLEWFGADTPWLTMQDVMSGRGREALKDMAWAPVNKLVSGFHPGYKALAEVPAKKTYYPDVRRPGRVRDVGLYMARQLAMEPEYKKMRGLPMRGDYKDSLWDALVYRYDPDESAFYETLDTVYRFKKDVLGRVDEIGGMLDPKSSALYWWRYAVKVGDRTAEEKFRNEYFAAGGTDAGLEKSFQSLHPLSGLNQGKMVKGIYVPGDADLFVDQMTPLERRKYDKAIAYFESLGGVASEEPEAAEEAAE